MYLILLEEIVAKTADVKFLTLQDSELNGREVSRTDDDEDGNEDGNEDEDDDDDDDNDGVILTLLLRGRENMVSTLERRSTKGL
ncbi:LOW QUALITY PROTEIN: hypothetical protein V1478_017338 [Vespula squamosa]|uniref:Uncharacterized protein n=1 Tax=Vespula squamosa TaxID=30214 RepID=A0ABD1ZXP2_VESSQ